MLRRRPPFADLVTRQLDLFATDNTGLLRDVDAALRSYDAAPADEAEQRYGDYVDLLDTARDELEEIRDTYARTLDEQAEVAYRDAFDDRARRRFPRIASEL